MFKCLDCDRVYKEKPDYCDCGNNTFEEIITTLAAEPSKKTFSQQYPQIKSFFENCDFISLSIFLICIILSVLILVFVQPAASVVDNAQDKNKPLVLQNIPSIEQLWINDVKKNEKKETQIQVEQQIKSPQITQLIKKSTNIVKPKTDKKKETKTITAPNASQEKADKPVKSDNVLANNSIVEKKEEAKNLNVKNEEEWNNYKVALRQALFNNLAVTSVVGSGECIIEFAIQKDGKIINRSFGLQSPNDSVNQAVYNMMMKLPYYYSPPAIYNGEKIKMKFLFKNGVYEISYI